MAVFGNGKEKVINILNLYARLMNILRYSLEIQLKNRDNKNRKKDNNNKIKNNNFKKLKNNSPINKYRLIKSQISNQINKNLAVIFNNRFLVIKKEINKHKI